MESRAGIDGDTNFAFFDGHVAKFSTVNYSLKELWTNISGHLHLTNQQTVFYLQMQL